MEVNFNLYRHARVAGTVATLIGFAFHNWFVIWFGNLVIFISYMWSVSKIEDYIEKQENKDARNS